MNTVSLPHSIEARRLMPIKGDSMAPALRPGDFVMVVPTSRYLCEGIYVVDAMGAPDLFRCEKIIGKDAVRLTKDNPAYAGHVATVAQFNANVLGIVYATCQVQCGIPLAELASMAREGVA